MFRHALLVLCISAGPLLSQSPTASITGRVTDSSGAIVSNVAIRAVDLEKNQIHTASTNHAGDYTIPYLTPGRYTLEAAAPGFSTYKRSAFPLDLDQEQRIDIKLEVGSATQTVTVSETPESLNTESGARGDVTSNAELTEMPLNGRNYQDLAFLTAGVVPRQEGADGQFAVNGARADNVGFLVDGMNNTQRRNTTVMVSPPLEGVQEFKLITSGFSAEYGRFAGGVLSLVTKSGGNHVRGSLYEFLRNDALDARNFFDVQKSKLIQNQFGATVTGPVRIPKLYNGRDKTFFLASWESQRQISGSTARGIVPTAQMLQGDFSKAVDSFSKPLVITDPLNKNAPFPGNQIPANRLDPVARNLAAYYPAPNLAGRNNYNAQANSGNDFDKYSLKMDHALGQNDRLTFTTFWNKNQSLNPFQRSPVAIFSGTNQAFGLLSGIRYLHTFTPTLFNEASASFSRNTLNQISIGSDHDWSAEAGFLGGTKNSIDLGIPYITVSGYIDLGQAYDLPKIWSYNNFQYTDAVTWIHGRHTFKLGGDFLHYQYFNHDYADLRGRLSFLGRFTGDPLADFVLGYAQTSRRLTQPGTEYLLVSNYSAFAQDDFKISPNLTLNIGLRYELMKQPKEKYDARSFFNPELGKLVIAGDNLTKYNDLIQSTGMGQYVVSARQAGLPDTLIRTNYLNFAPRFGFAWRPFGTKRGVIRGGYGIFYGTDSLYRYDSFTDTFPFLNLQTYSATATNPLLLTVSNAFPESKAKTAGISNSNGQNPSSPTQYLQTYNMTFERDLAHGTVLEVAYAGSKGTHLPRYYNLNQQSIVPGKGVGVRPFPVFATINVINNVSNSRYNSGTATLRHRLSSQFFIRVNYTFSKSIDESSNTGGVVAGNFPTAQNAYDLKAERGRSDFDVGHTFAASFIYRPQFSRNVLARDWQISGTATAYTGSPFTPKVANYDITTGGAARPNRIASGKLAEPNTDQWFDRTAFPIVPVGSFQFGTSGRNIIDGPGTFVLNTGISRRFQLKEKTAFQFRGEAFNLANHANFNLPQTQVDVLNGATISAAKSPRLMQVALRLEF